MSEIVVSPESLDAFAVQVGMIDEEIRDAVDSLGSRVAQVSETWTGDAATRYRSAHEEWLAGLVRMRAGLLLMRDGLKIAAMNHQGATDANLAMWS